MEYYLHGRSQRQKSHPLIQSIEQHRPKIRPQQYGGFFIRESFLHRSSTQRQIVDYSSLSHIIYSMPLLHDL